MKKSKKGKKLMGFDGVARPFGAVTWTKVTGEVVVVRAPSWMPVCLLPKKDVIRMQIEQEVKDKVFDSRKWKKRMQAMSFEGLGGVSL